MSLLRKSLDAVTIADLKALIEAGARETGELEFKGALPFQQSARKRIVGSKSATVLVTTLVMKYWPKLLPSPMPTGELEQAFLDRTSIARSLFVNIKKEPDKGVPPLLLKVTALPTIFQNISGITMRPNLWWQGKAFTTAMDGQGLQCAYPAREFGDPPKIRLRSFERDDRPLSRGTQRFIRGDGLVKFCFFLSTSEPSQRSGAQSILYVGWLLSLVVGAMAQVEHLRRNLAWDAVDFGLQIEIWGDEPIAVVRGDNFFESNILPGARPFAFPRYAVGPFVDFDALVTAIVQDLFNACGASGNWPCTVPWSELLKD